MVHRAGDYKRCAIYARVSTDKQAKQDISVPDQIARAKYFAETEGWEVAKVFSDPGASAKDDRKRPKFREMMAEACAPHHPFDIILVHNFARFYRDPAWFELHKRELRKHRVRIVSVSEPVTDDFTLSILTLLDGKKITDTSRDVRRAMQANARDGFRNGGTTPFGYKLVEAAKRGAISKHKLEVRDDEATVVRLIFDLHQRGLGMKAIAQHLNEQTSYRTRNGNKWGKSTVERILKSETYTGRSYFRPKDPDTGETVPKSEWIEIPCPAIIDESTFRSVQEQLVRRTPKVTAPRITTSPVVLGGLARCGSCGRALHLCTGKGLRYLKCSGKLKYGECAGGDPISIRESELDQAVLHSLAERIFTRDRIIELVAEVYARRSSEREGVGDRLKSLKRQLADVARKEKNLWDVASSIGLTDAAGFREKLLEFSQQKESLTRDVAAQQALLANSVRLIGSEEANTVAEEMRQLIFSTDTQLRRAFVRAFVNRVDVFSDEIHIAGKASAVAEAVMRASDPERRERRSRF
jgi:DNA invertase Pin-like site-specific DNA recombinase